MIYLDHAATSFPKPPPVLAAVADWFANIGVSATRGDSARTRAAAAQTAQARNALATLLGMRPQRVAFTAGATESANLFLRGFLRRGDRVVTTAAEHAAVARPLRALRDELDVQTDVVPVDGDGYVDPDAVARALRAAPARLLAVNHASNVTGAVQDIAALRAHARAQGCTFLLDVSQTAGSLALGPGSADVLFGSAHKGLLAPPGLGFLAVDENVPVRPAKQGGTGSSAALDEQPTAWPWGFEAGTPNGPAIAGLGAALGWLAAQPAAAIHARAVAAVDALRLALRDRLGARVRLLGRTDRARVGVLSFTLADLDPAEAGMLLDGAGIAVRTGFHCAPWIHAWLDTTTAGTIRVSPGPFVTADEVLAVARAIAP